MQAKLADKIAIVRSCHHTMASHSDGGIQVLTGKTPLVADPTSQSKSDHPDLGHLASHFRSTPDNDIRSTLPFPAVLT